MEAQRYIPSKITIKIMYMYLLELRLSEDASKKVAAFVGFLFFVFVKEFLTFIPMKYDCQPAILVVLKTGEKCIKFRNGRKTVADREQKVIKMSYMSFQLRLANKC